MQEWSVASAFLVAFAGAAQAHHGDWFASEWFSPVVERSASKTIDEGTAAVPSSSIDVANLVR